MADALPITQIISEQNTPKQIEFLAILFIVDEEDEEGGGEKDEVFELKRTFLFRRPSIMMKYTREWEIRVVAHSLGDKDECLLEARLLGKVHIW